MIFVLINERSSRKRLYKVVLGSVMYVKYCNNGILPYFPVQLNDRPHAVSGVIFYDLGNAESGTTEHGIVSVGNIYFKSF